MREGLRDIVAGWTLNSGFHDITDRIECAAEWAKNNGPLEPDEEATIKLMIEAQIARGIRDGHFEPFISGDDHDHDEQPDEDLYDDPGISDRARI